MPADRSKGRWHVTWRYSRPDPMVWVVIAAGLFLTVFSIIDGWGFGAAMGGWLVGVISVWWAFISDHFRMTDTTHSGRTGDTDGT